MGANKDLVVGMTLFFVAAVIFSTALHKLVLDKPHPSDAVIGAAIGTAISNASSVRAGLVSRVSSHRGALGQHEEAGHDEDGGVREKQE